MSSTTQYWRSKGMAVGSHKELSSLGSQKHRCCVRLAALCSFSSDVVLPRARCTTRLWALLLVIASAPRTRPLTPYAAAAAPSGLGAAPAARPPFSIKTPQWRFSGFRFSRPPPCLPVRGLFEKINLQEKRPCLLMIPAAIVFPFSNRWPTTTPMLTRSIG